MTRATLLLLLMALILLAAIAVNLYDLASPSTDAFSRPAAASDPSELSPVLTSVVVGGSGNHSGGAEDGYHGVPSVPSATSLDIADYALATPLVGFGGLHPVSESWSRGVASGIASTVGSRFPDWYLALPIGPGFRVRIVGAGGSVERVSTDAGPALHLQRRPFNRVADLSVADFVHVCGVPASFGLCQVSVTVMGRT